MSSSRSSVLPPGFYIVGDPCYSALWSKGTGAIDKESRQDTWIALLESADYELEPRILEAKVEKDGRLFSFTAAGTAYGDGCYLDQVGRKYPVDAGMIGVTPVPPEADLTNEELYTFGTHLVEFPEAFRVEYELGVITIGALVINTAEEDEEEEEEDEG